YQLGAVCTRTHDAMRPEATRRAYWILVALSGSPAASGLYGSNLWWPIDRKWPDGASRPSGVGRHRQPSGRSSSCNAPSRITRYLTSELKRGTHLAVCATQKRDILVKCDSAQTTQSNIEHAGAAYEGTF